jgi:hypothetical protein
MNFIVIRVLPKADLGHNKFHPAVNVTDPTFLDVVDAIDVARRNSILSVDIYADQGQFVTMAGVGMAEKITEITGIPAQYYPGSRTIQLVVE